MRLRLALASALLCLLASVAVAQTISPPIVTASQRAIWDREKAENHPYFRQACSEADKDTTTGERYGSRGRWSALCYQMGGNPAYAQKAYDVTKRISQTWTPGSLGTSNELREHAVEHVVTLTWVAPALTAAQIAEWKGWLVSNADASIAATLRLNDTDQTTGTLFFWCTMDRAFGTDYCTRQKALDAREAVKRFISYGEGGGYPVMGDYEWGDLFLLFQGAEFAGLEQFPEVAAFRESVAKAVIQWTTPDLLDSFELGDDQSPNQILPHAREDLLAYLGHFHPAVRAYEMEVRQLLNWPDDTPMYARYFFWANPYQSGGDWRSFAGTWLVNPNLGRVYHKTGWSAADCGLLAYLPPLSNGVSAHDHIYGWFGHIRLRCDSKWVLDSPIGYSGHRALGNHTVIAGLPASGEVGLLTAAQQVGRVVYVSGTNAGLNVNSVYYNPPGTHRHEQSPSFVYIPSWRALVKIERIHVDDPKTLPITPTSSTLSITRYSASLQAIINASPLIRSYWHSQTVEPQIQDGVITNGDMRVRPLYPATMTVVNMAGGSYGTLADREKKWHVTVDPIDQAPGFRVLTTLVGDITGTVEQVTANVQRLRLQKAGERAIVLYSSTTPGPKLLTTRSGSSAVYDRSKADGILAARAVVIDEAWADPTADVFVEQANGLVQLNPPAPVPAPDLEAQLKDARAEIQRLLAQAQVSSQQISALQAQLVLVNAELAALKVTAADAEQRATQATARATAVEDLLRQIRVLVN